MARENHITVPTSEGYDLWSEFYDDYDNPLVQLEEPILDQLFSEVSGKSFLDLGCGTGRHSIRFAKKGAEVVGLDNSQGMLEKAQKKALEILPQSKRPKFQKFDLDQGTYPFHDQTFDIIGSFLALEHIQNLGHFFSECKRLVKKEGKIVFTFMHPAMLLKGVQARFNHPESGDKIYPLGRPYQISDYYNEVIKAGLKVSSISEHQLTDKDRVSAKNEKYINWPLLLIFEVEL
jgi:SAM-dependent methyltransferase